MASFLLYQLCAFFITLTCATDTATSSLQIKIMGNLHSNLTFYAQIYNENGTIEYWASQWANHSTVLHMGDFPLNHTYFAFPLADTEYYKYELENNEGVLTENVTTVKIIFNTLDCPATWIPYSVPDSTGSPFDCDARDTEIICTETQNYTSMYTCVTRRVCVTDIYNRAVGKGYQCVIERQSTTLHPAMPNKTENNCANFNFDMDVCNNYRFCHWVDGECKQWNNYTLIGSGVECMPGPTTTYTGWANTSLEQCQQYCTQNATNSDAGAAEQAMTCSFAVWDSDSRVCRLAARCMPLVYTSNTTHVWQKEVSVYYDSDYWSCPEWRLNTTDKGVPCGLAARCGELCNGPGYGPLPNGQVMYENYFGWWNCAVQRQDGSLFYYQLFRKYCFGEEDSDGEQLNPVEYSDGDVYYWDDNDWDDCMDWPNNIPGTEFTCDDVKQMSENFFDGEIICENAEYYNAYVMNLILQYCPVTCGSCVDPPHYPSNSPSVFVSDAPTITRAPSAATTPVPFPDIDISTSVDGHIAGIFIAFGVGICICICCAIGFCIYFCVQLMKPRPPQQYSLMQQGTGAAVVNVNNPPNQNMNYSRVE